MIETAQSVVGRGPATTSGGGAIRGVRDQRPLAVLTVAYAGAVWGIEWATGLAPAGLGWRSLLSSVAFAAGLAVAVAGCLLAVFGLTWTVGRLSRAGGRARPFGSPWSVWRTHLSIDRMAGAFVTLFLYAVLMNVFVGIKGQIPALHPFAWDEAFMRLDRALHFGHAPWALLQPWVGTPGGTAFLDRVYYAWFPINLIFLIGVAWRPSGPLRERFFLAFFGLWILLGTIMAVAFSSAGPCYYGRVVAGSDPYGPLMDYLHRVDAVHSLTALDVQDLLWAGYVGRGRLVEGIAAMPSLHVAVPVLFTIVGWRIDRRLGAAFALYTALILIGSVHLAWHYAIDGYVTVALVPAVWWLAGRPARGRPAGP